jgi:phosphoribosylformimino-5-aminoimidazole carboxamide ribotide isomerase
VLDLSCRYYPEEGHYYIMTDRWQKRTRTPLTKELMEYLKSYCDEFLVHAVDVEGKGRGIDERLVRLLAEEADFPVTYAGGIRSADDIALLDRIGGGRIDFTVGSALDIYGGSLSYEALARDFGKK